MDSLDVRGAGRARTLALYSEVTFSARPSWRRKLALRFSDSAAGLLPTIIVAKNRAIERGKRGQDGTELLAQDRILPSGLLQRMRVEEPVPRGIQRRHGLIHLRTDRPRRVRNRRR